MSTEAQLSTLSFFIGKYLPELALAESPETTPQQLEYLSSTANPLLRRAIAQNPNTPLAVLYPLSAAFPEEILKNPSLPLFSLEDPNFLLRFPEAGILAMLRSELFPREYLPLLLRYPSEKVRLRILLSKGLPFSLRKELVQQGRIAAALLKQRNVDSGLLYLLLGHPDAEIRAGAASRPNAPQKLLALFRFLGVEPSLRDDQPARSSLRALLTPDDERLILGCGPFGERLLSVREASHRRSRRRPPLRYRCIGRNRTGSAFGHWRAFTSARR
jgi:hypothetical protein